MTVSMIEQTALTPTGKLVIIPIAIHDRPGAWKKWQFLLLTTAFFNLFVVALLGVVLRSWPFVDITLISFKNLLHAHSHFAFGGWLMPLILALVMKSFPTLRYKISFSHWRNIAIITLISSYGMLFTFPFTGYALASVFFSTLSMLAGFYLAILTWKAMRKMPVDLPLKFLSGGLFYYVISSLGPFITGPLIAMGYKGEPIYFNAIYFYLHFQYNGWFLFVLFALFYHIFQSHKGVKHGHAILSWMHLSLVPSFFLSVLWNQPGWIFNMIGGLGAIFQLVAFYWLGKDVARIPWKLKGSGLLFVSALGFLLVKGILQLFSALPAVAALAYQFRNFIISYLHMVLLGIISMFLIAAMMQVFKFTYSRQMKTALLLFALAFFSTEIILVAQATMAVSGYLFPRFHLSMLVFSIFFPAGFFLMWLEVRKQARYRLR